MTKSTKNVDILIDRWVDSKTDEEVKQILNFINDKKEFGKFLAAFDAKMKAKGYERKRENSL